MNPIFEGLYESAPRIVVGRSFSGKKSINDPDGDSLSRRMKDNKEILGLKLKLWFSSNQLYPDGSNVYDWLPKLKKKLEELLNINLNEEEEKTKEMGE